MQNGTNWLKFEKWALFLAPGHDAVSIDIQHHCLQRPYGSFPSLRLGFFSNFENLVPRLLDTLNSPRTFEMPQQLIGC